MFCLGEKCVCVVDVVLDVVVRLFVDLARVNPFVVARFLAVAIAVVVVVSGGGGSGLKINRNICTPGLLL